MLFNELPAELKISILGLLDCPDLLRVSSLNESWHSVVEQTVSLQHTIELYSDGLKALPSAIPHSEQLELIRKRRRNWQHLTASYSYLRRDGLHCKAYDLAGRTFVQIRQNQLIRVRLHHRDGLTIEMQDLQEFPEDVALDPSQDLIVFLRAGGPIHSRIILISVLSLSTLQQHPEAKERTIFYPLVGLTTPNIRSPQFTQIVHDIVMLFTSPEEGADIKRLVAWNWKKCITLFDIHSAWTDLPSPLRPQEHVLTPTVYDCSFLSSNAFLLTDVAPPGRFVICSFDSEHPISEPRPLVTLLLPPIQAGVEIVEFTIHSSASQRNQMTHEGETEKPFMADPDARVHVVQLKYRMQVTSFDDPADFTLLLVVHHDAFRRYLDSRFLASEVPQCQDIPCVPWAEWGPHCTRILSDHISDDLQAILWLRYVHGSKLSLPSRSSGIIKVVDFGRGVQRRARHRDSDETSAAEDAERGNDDFVTAPTVVMNDAIFRDEIRTYLPYCIWSKKVPDVQRCDAVLVDDDCLLGIKNYGRNAGLHMYTIE